MTSNVRQNLPAFVGLLGLIPIATGIYGAISPLSAMETAFGWKAPTDPASEKLVETLMRLHSFRSIGFGAGSIALWYAGNVRVQGAFMLSCWVVALGDGLTCFQYTGDIADGMKHWFAIPVSIGLGSALLGWI